MSRREQGSGSYRKRSSGSWQLTVRDGEGNRLTKTVKASSAAEAKRMLRAFVSSVSRREVPKAKQKPTVAQAADMWLSHKMRIKRDLAEATIDSLEFALLNSVDADALRKDFPDLTDAEKVTAWAESDENFMWLCAKHHRGHGGAHHAAFADFTAELYVRGLIDA